ncbi:MAG: choice-of-anchor D domain-containing protein [Bacteroidetes bacterium]|nr:choice-of-anchor D domain-containing protein [Bacteroidota bacterium]
MKKFLHSLIIALCFSLNSYAQPNITIAPASFSVTIANCNDSVTLPLTINNTGTAPLTFNLYDHQTTFMKLYAGNEDINNISEFDMNTNTFTGGPFSSGNSPWRLAISPKGDRIFASNRYSNNVYVYNTANNALITIIPVGNFPSGMCFTPDGRFCFVTNRNGNSVSKINCSTNTVIATITVNISGPMDAAVTPDGNKLYVINKNTDNVTVYNANTNAYITTIASIMNGHSIVMHPDGRYVYVGEANFSTDNVVVISTATNTVVASVGIFDQVHGIDITPDGKYLYALDKWNGWVQVIQTSTNTVVDTIIDGRFYNGWDLVISPKGDYAYVTNKWNNPNFIIIDLSNNTIASSTNTSGGANSWPAGLASLNSWATWMNESAQSGIIAASGNTVVNVEFNALGLSAGIYTGVIYINSNAPSSPSIAVPCTLTVVGAPNINIPLANSCPKFDTILVNAADADTFNIQNLNCGTLNITNIVSSSGDFDIVSYPASIPGYSSGQLIVAFNPLSIGNKTTVITVQNNNADTAFCLQGVSLPAPTIGISPASLSATINSCNDSITLPLTINNTGGGPLNYSLILSPSTSGAKFYDGFESGNFASWNIGAGAYTRTVTTTNPANGLYSFQLIGGNGVNYDGVNHTFPLSTSNYLSYKFMSPIGSTGWNCGVGVGRTSDITTNQGIADSWIDNASMEVYLYCSSGTYTVPMVQGQWYKIEYRNINYTTKKFDYYVNGSLVGSNLTFWNTNINSINVIHLMGWDPGQTSKYDEIVIGNDPSAWLFPSPLSGTSAPFGSSIVNVKMKSSNVVDGTYYGNILVNSNDPLTPQVAVPCTLTVNGSPNINIPLLNSCPKFDTLFVGAQDQDTFQVQNLGCDTLYISNVPSTTYFIVDTFPAKISPYSTGTILITFQPTAVGSFATGILVQNSDADTTFCLQGVALPPPTIVVDPTSFNVSVACSDSLTDTLTIYNVGGSDLYCQITGGGAQKIKVLLAGADYANYYTDVQTKLMSTGKFSVVDIFDARNGTPTLAQLQAYDAVLTWTDYSYSNSTLLGNNLADYIDGGGGVVAAVFTTGNYSRIGGRFDSQNYWCINPTGYYYGGANQTLGTIYNPTHPIMKNVVSLTGNSRPNSTAIMAGAVKIADWSDGIPLVVTKNVNGHKRVDLGMWPASNDVTGGNSWVSSTNGALLMANALHYSANGGVNWMTLSPPAADTISPGDSTKIAVEFNSTGLSAGTYTTTISVTSNDPVNPVVTVPVTFSVVGNPNMGVSLFDIIAPSCLDLDSIMALTTSKDSIAISNSGCDTLRIDSLKFSPSIFSLVSSPAKVAPGQTKNIVVRFSPIVAGTFTGTLNIYTNELDTAICLKGKAFPNPIMCWNPDTFNVTLGCGDSITLPLIICNTGNQNLNFGLTGQDGFCGTAGNIRVAVYNNATITALLNTQADMTATTVSTYNAASLANYDVLMNIRNSNLDQAAVLNWISNGGTWIGEWSSNPFPISTWGAITGTTGGGTSGSISVSINDPSHYLAQNINWASMPVGANPCDFMYDLNITDPAAKTIINVNHSAYGINPLLVEKKYGQGKIILFNWDYQDAPNYNAVVQDMIEEVVRYGGGGLEWICPDTTSGTVAYNDTMIVNVEFNASTLNVGQYTTTLFIASNDPQNPNVQIPCTLNVTGVGNFVYAGMSDITAPNCLDLDSIMEFTTSNDTIYIANNGCDTLFIDSLKFSPSVFSSGIFTPYILPGDTGGFVAQFSPVSAGNFTGTASVYTNDLDTVFCLKGKSFPRPVISTDPDTFNITLTCSDTLIDTLTIYNTGLNNLIYNIDTSDYSARFDGNGDVIYRNVPSGLPTGNTPVTVEAWIYPQGYNDASYNGIVSWGNRGCTGNGFVLSIQSNGRPSMALWCNDFVPGSGPAATLNQWNHIACVLNGTSVTLYMNGVPVSGTISPTQGFTSTNLAIGCTDWWGRFFTGRIDEVRIWNKARTQAEILSTMNQELTGNEPNLVSYFNFDNINANDLAGSNNCSLAGNATILNDNAATFYSLNGNLNDTVAPSDSSQIAVQFVSTGLTIGNYSDFIQISSNDPLNNPLIVPVNLTVVGAAGLAVSDTCLFFDTIMEFTNIADTFYISNTGCDTLFVSATTTLNFWIDSLSVDSASGYILPGDTAKIPIFFSPDSAGNFTGTLNLYTNAGDSAICLNGYAYPRPIICHNPDTFNITINICQDTVTSQLLICNSGGSNLYWNILTQSSICDDFDPAINNPMWSFENGFLSTNCGSMSGNALYFNNAGVRQAATIDLNTLAGGNINFAIRLGSGGICEYLDPGEDIVFEYSNNGGGSWTNISTYYSGTNLTFTSYVIPVPAGAKTSSTRFRWRQLSHSGSCCDHWALDNVCITTGSANIIPVPSSDTTAAGDTTIVTIYFTDSGLVAGTYTIPILINSNDPLNSFDTVIVNLTIDSLPSAPPVANDVNVCFGNPTPPLIAVPVNSSDTVKWYSDGALTTLVYVGGTFNTGQTAVGTYTYYVTATDTTTMCQSLADTVHLYINTAPLEPTASDASSCFGNPTPTLISSGTIIQWYTSLPPTAPVGTGPYSTGLTAVGTYTFFVTDSTGGCPESIADTVVLSIYALPNKPLAKDTAVCFGGPIPPLTATVTGTDSIRWYNTAMIFQASGDTFNTGQTAAGTYTYYVTSVDTVTYCESVRDTAKLTINSTPLPTSNNVSSCFGSPTPPLVATPNNSIQWYDNLMNPLAANDTLITGLTAVGTYTFYVTQTLNGCPSNPLMVTLTINPIPSAPVAPDVSSCFGSPTPPLTATGTNIKWYSDAALTVLVATGSPYNTGLTAVGNYTFYVTQTTSGCPSPSDTVYLDIYALPVTPIATNTFVCFGNPTPDLVATNITGNDTVHWYSNPTLAPIVFTGNPFATTQTAVATYTYYVTQTDTATGCRSKSDTVTLAINGAPVEPTANDVAVCVGSPAVLTSSGTIPQWFNNPALTPVIYTGSPYNTGLTVIGTYTFFVTDSVAGCPQSPADTAVLTINPVPIAPVSVPQKDSICFGSPNPSFAAAGTNIQWWSNPTTTTLVFAGSPFTPTVTATGTYSYYVTQSSLGCKSPSDTVTFRINPVPVVNLGADVTQCGGTVTLNAGNPISNYLWSTGATIQSIIVSVTGTYSVVVTNAGGCTGTDVINVTINPIPVAPVSVPQGDTICFGNPNPTFTAAGTNIQWWSNPTLTTLVFSGAAFTPTVTAAGSYTYYVTQTTTGCKSPSDTVNFLINFTPALAVNDTNVSFGTPPVVLSAGGTNVQWYDTSGAVVGTGNSYNTGETAIGTYTYYVTQTMNNCEGAKDTVILTIFPGAPLGVGGTVCFGQPVPDLTAAGTNIQWWSNPALTILAGTGSPFATGQTAAGTYTYYVTQTINFVQSPSDTVLLTVNALPSVPVSSNQNACFGGIIPDMIAAGTNIQWYDTSGAVVGTGSPFATGETAVGSYTYMVTQTNTVTTCESPSDTVTLTINALPATPTASNDTAICFGDPIPNLSAVGTNITWYDGLGNFVTTGSPFPPGVSAPGTYTFIATQTNTVTTCESLGDTVLLTINSIAPPLAPDVAVCFGNPVPPLVATGTNIQWYDTSGALVFSGSPFNTGQTAVGTYTYYVTQTNTVTTCSSPQDTVYLIISTQPTLPPSVSDTDACFGSVIPDLVSTTGTIINWYDALMNPLFSGNPFSTGMTAVGSYTFFATDSTPGCPEGPADPAVLVINALPATLSVNDTATCFGSLTPDLIAVGTNITWYDTAMAIVSVNDTFATGETAAGTYTYYVTQTNTVTGCASVADSVLLTINALPSTPVALDTAVCSAAAIPNLTSTGTNVQWYDTSGAFVFTGNSYSTGQTSVGVHTYYVTQLDGITGCESAADTATLTIMLSPPVPIANNVAVCTGNPIPPLTSTGTNVQWYSDAALTTLVNTGNSFNTGQTAVGVYTYWVTDSLTGCVSSSADSATLTINAVPLEPTATDVTICYGGSSVLSSNGANPQWYSDVTLINMVHAGSTYTTGITAVGIYTYYVTDYAAGCGNSPADTAVLTINPVPLVTANTYSTAILLGNSTNLTAYNASTYIWAPPAGLNTTTGSTVVANPSVTTTYTVTGTNQYGCSSSVSILVLVNPLGVIDFGNAVQDVTIYPNPAIDQFTLEFNSTIETPINIYMLNMLGERVSVMKSDEVQGGGLMKHTYLINTSAFTEGVYTIEIVTEKGTVNRRVVLFR